jgi:hypothetical protein
MNTRAIPLTLGICAALNGCVRTDHERTPATVLAPAELLTVLGRAGGEVEFGDVARLAARAGILYAADRMERRIYAFDSDGVLLAVWGSEGSGPGEFRRPGRIVPASDGSVWIADEGQSHVARFTGSGAYLSTVRIPLPFFSIHGSEVVVAGGREGAVATFLGETSLRSLDGSVAPLGALTLPRLLSIVPLNVPEEGLFLFDNAAGGLWKAAPADGGARLEPVPLPPWLVSLARETNEKRVKNAPQVRGILSVPYFEDIKVDGDRLWFFAGWPELLGARLAAAAPDSGVVAVVPSAEREFVGMVDAVLVDDSTMAAAYRTELRLYRLRPALAPRG